MKRTAYVLVVDPHSERAQWSKSVLDAIGFEVVLFPCIPNADPFLSNKLSMQAIYARVRDSPDPYSYVFEDDINCLESIRLDEIVEYEAIAPMFFYLGMCETQSFGVKTNTRIRTHPVYVVQGTAFGLHAIGLSKQGAAALLSFSQRSSEPIMDVIVKDFSAFYPAPVVRYDLQSTWIGHRGVIFQDRQRFPSRIGQTAHQNPPLK